MCTSFQVLVDDALGETLSPHIRALAISVDFEVDSIEWASQSKALKNEIVFAISKALNVNVNDISFTLRPKL